MTIMDKDNNTTNGTLPIFEVPEKVNIIKVIGVGGGGGNAVNHMYREGIHDVSFALCNTGAQRFARTRTHPAGQGRTRRGQRAREGA